MNAFEAAMNDIMADEDITQAAVYCGADGAALPIRIAWRQDLSADTYGYDTLAGAKYGRRYLQVLKTAIPDPRSGDRIAVGQDTYTVDGPDLTHSDQYLWVLTVTP